MDALPPFPMPNPSTGITGLSELIANMEPVLNEGEYVFVTVAEVSTIPREMPICEIKEKEGITVVLAKEAAESLNLSFDYVASWITLNVHSSLAAVGLTAAFATALSSEGISCNVVAGYYHDHIFVNQQKAQQALAILWAMTGKSE